ncbi:MAG: gamma-butyrobetaine dioxygenase [Planctomycetota bacterium]|jgi:gamma-butyrobetaine dioxygenase
MTVQITIDPGQRKLLIRWGDGVGSEFHLVWLRHHARCPDGMPNDTSIKIDLLPDDPATLAIESYAIDGDYLCINWQDGGLQTRHQLHSLRCSAYDPGARRARKHQPTLWNGESAVQIPNFDFDALDSEAVQLELLIAVRDYGVAKIIGMPVESGSVRNVAKLFGPIHINNYGELFDVKSDAHKSLGSNTGVYLPPHTDESYRHDAPGISFFHCLVAEAMGGESILVDGFNAAALLKKSDPESFDVLASVPIFFQRYAMPDEDMRSHTRVVVCDVDGDVVGIRWTDRTLPPQDLPALHVEPVYRAIKSFWNIFNDERQQHCYRLAAGEMHVFDNHRVLHGRNAFDPQSGLRHLQQCSVNRDEFHNSLRILAARLGSPAGDLIMAGGAVG